jgi:hypothetical protein
MTDIVLVHGTTQTAAGFRELVAALERDGHRPVAVDVPGAAASTSTEYAELLAERLPDLDRPIVVAHSAAGLLLPALAKRLDARHQVWLAAAVADYADGRSFLDEVREAPTDVMQSDWLGVDPTSDPVLATHFLFHDADLARLREGLETLALCDLSAVYAEVPPLDPTSVPSTYVLPDADRTLQHRWMVRVSRDRLGVEPTIVPGGHNCYAADPERIAAVITDASRG